MKTSDLTGVLLDYWVARAEGRKLEKRDDEWFVENNARCWMFELAFYRPSTNWTYGGPIIEREGIELVTFGLHETQWSANPEWQFPGCNDYSHIHTGPTPLIAAMRAFVASKFGDAVSDEATA